MPIIRAAMRLFPCLFSTESQAIMRAVADRGPICAEDAARLAGIDPPRGCTLLAELRGRGLIADEGNGFRLADPEVWASFLVYLDRAKDLKEAPMKYPSPWPAVSA